jgi:hypothetical protein
MLPLRRSGTQQMSRPQPSRGLRLSRTSSALVAAGGMSWRYSMRAVRQAGPPPAMWAELVLSIRPGSQLTTLFINDDVQSPSYRPLGFNRGDLIGVRSECPERPGGALLLGPWGALGHSFSLREESLSNPSDGANSQPRCETTTWLPRERRRCSAWTRQVNRGRKGQRAHPHPVPRL